MEAVLLRADHLSAKNDWKLEKADMHLQYKDKEGNTLMVNTDLDLINMKRECKLLFGPSKPKELVIETPTKTQTKKGKKNEKSK